MNNLSQNQSLRKSGPTLQTVLSQTLTSRVLGQTSPKAVKPQSSIVSRSAVSPGLPAAQQQQRTSPMMRPIETALRTNQSKSPKNHIIIKTNKFLFKNIQPLEPQRAPKGDLGSHVGPSSLSGTLPKPIHDKKTFQQVMQKVVTPLAPLLRPDASRFSASPYISQTSLPSQ